MHGKENYSLRIKTSQTLTRQAGTVNQPVNVESVKAVIYIRCATDCLDFNLG